MKNLKLMLVTLILCFTTTLTFGQTVNGVQIKDLDVEYVRIVGTSNLTNTKVTVDLEFGQQNKLFSAKDTKVLGADGTPLVLNSMVDALNFMDANGYEFVTAYVVTVGTQNVYHYLMRKKRQ